MLLPSVSGVSGLRDGDLSREEPEHLIARGSTGHQRKHPVRGQCRVQARHGRRIGGECRSGQQRENRRDARVLGLQLGIDAEASHARVYAITAQEDVCRIACAVRECRRHPVVPLLDGHNVLPVVNGGLLFLHCLQQTRD